MMLGVCAYSFAIGSLTSLLSTMDSREAKLKVKTGILEDIRGEYDIDYELYLRLMKQLKYDHSKNVVDKFELIKELPQNLKIELSLVIHKSIINKFKFFKDKPKDFLAFLGPRLKPVKFLEGEYIYKEGDSIEEIYFLIKGKIGFVHKDFLDIPYISIEEGI
jgi:hypothetical protein